MPFLRSALTRANPLENPAVPLTSTALLDMLGMDSTSSGVSVTPHKAITYGPVFRATSVVSALSGWLPMHAYQDGTFNRVPSPILKDPHPDLTGLEFWSLVASRRSGWGNFYAQKVRSGAGELRWLYPIDPSRVKVGKAKPSTANPSGKYFQVTLDDGSTDVWTSREMLHIPHVGYDGVCGLSPVRAARAAIGLGLAAEDYGAKLFGSGTLLSGILQTEQRLDKNQAEALKDRWQAKMAGRAHEVAVLDAGAKFQPLTMPNDDAQFLESRDFQVTDVSRFWGVPPFLMFQTEKSTSWGTGLEQQMQGFVTVDLGPVWLGITEARVTKELLPDDQYAKYQLQGLLRGDSKARAEFYRAMRELGGMSANEMRELEEEPPIENGGGYLQPANLVPLGTTTTTEGGGAGAGANPAGA